MHHMIEHNAKKKIQDDHGRLFERGRFGSGGGVEILRNMKHDIESLLFSICFGFWMFFVGLFRLLIFLFPRHLWNCKNLTIKTRGTCQVCLGWGQVRGARNRLVEIGTQWIFRVPNLWDDPLSANGQSGLDVSACLQIPKCRSLSKSKPLSNV